MNNTSTTSNMTDGSNDSESNALFYTAKYLTLYIQPIVCSFGLLGNLLSVIIFLSKDLRKISSNIYLTALSASSCLFLLSVLCVWLEVVGVPLIHKPVCCQAVVFVTYVCSFLSVWFIVCITVENYVVTFHIKRTMSFCTVKRARILVICFTCIGILLYLFSIWSTQVIAVPGMDIRVCSVAPEYAELTTIVTYIDSVVSLFLPSLLTILLLVAILFKTICLRGKRTDYVRRISKMERSLLRVTRVLLAISLTFVVLSAPSQIHKLKHLIFASNNRSNASLTDQVAQQICQIIYYTSFSFYFIFYMTWSANYRKGVRKLFHFKSINVKMNNTAMSAMTNGHTAGGNDKPVRSTVTVL